MRSISELRNIYAGADVWVIASGPTAGYVDPKFFEGKVTLGVNRVWKRFSVGFCVFKEFEFAREAARAGVQVITSLHHCGNLEYRLNDLESERAWWFEHAENRIGAMDLSVIDPREDRIVVSHSTITSTMHLAAYMGAANILLVGHTCGLLDGKRNYEGYGDSVMAEADYLAFLEKIEPESIAVRDRLQAVYGVRVYSLNPFLNLGMEGHEYQNGTRNRDQLQSDAGEGARYGDRGGVYHHLDPVQAPGAGG